MTLFSIKAWAGSLAALLFITHPALAQDDPQAKYEEYAQACRDGQGTDGSNPCRDAMWYYGGHFSVDHLEKPLRLYRENCREDGKITGCGPLHSFYAGNEQLFADGTRRSWPAEPEKALQALQTGCIATLEGVSNCGSLGVIYENAGDFEKAGAAYKMGCEAGMKARADEYFGQERVCYWAAKNARDNLQDDASARRWFAYTCEAGEDPFACKFLGLMVAQGEGADADPVEAIGLYSRACNMIDDIAQGDGQACYLLGESLIVQRDKVVSHGWMSGFRPANADDDLAGLQQENLTAASRAFLRGCMDDRSEACAAHEDLLKRWTDGDFPRHAHACRVRDVEGQLMPEKLCQRFAFYLPPPEGSGDVAETQIFVWPDGDRTVTFDDHGVPSLNGAEGEWLALDDDWECIRSSITGRSFCYEPY